MFSHSLPYVYSNDALLAALRLCVGFFAIYNAFLAVHLSVGAITRFTGFGWPPRHPAVVHNFCAKTAALSIPGLAVRGFWRLVKK